MELNYNKVNLDIYNMYLDSNKARNFESMKTTYKIYKSNMMQFLVYLQKNEGNRLLLSESTLKKSVEILERYINQCRDSGNNNQTINNKLTAISSFYIWAVKRDLISHHPFQHKLDRLKKGDFDKRRESYFLSMEDIIRARILMQHNSKKFDIQSRLIWDLFLESAARISALNNLKITQLKNGYFAGVREKGNKMVDIIFLNNTDKNLKEWLQEREVKGIDNEFLFLTKRDGKYVQMGQSTMRNRIKKIGLLIGYEKLYPHTLRKTAINILKGLSDLNTASEFANHSSTKVTRDHYIKGNTGEENREKFMQIRREKGMI